MKAAMMFQKLELQCKVCFVNSLLRYACIMIWFVSEMNERKCYNTWRGLFTAYSCGRFHFSVLTHKNYVCSTMYNTFVSFENYISYYCFCILIDMFKLLLCMHFAMQFHSFMSKLTSRLWQTQMWCDHAEWVGNLNTVFKIQPSKKK